MRPTNIQLSYYHYTSAKYDFGVFEVDANETVCYHHVGACMHACAKTKDILYVQQLLGHKQLKTTLRYTQLVQLPHQEKYICKVAQTVEEAKELVEAGFKYVTDIDNCKLFKKKKLTFLGAYRVP